MFVWAESKRKKKKRRARSLLKLEFLYVSLARIWNSLLTVKEETKSLHSVNVYVDIDIHAFGRRALWGDCRE